MTITFQTRAGDKVTGDVIEDYGHALLIRVTAANRKNLRDRTTLFPKHDLGGAIVDGQPCKFL